MVEPPPGSFNGDMPAEHQPTKLPRWTTEPGDGALGLEVAVPGGLPALAVAMGEPADRLVLAATIRVVSLLAAETDITIGQQIPGPPMAGAAGSHGIVPVRVALPAGSWRELVAAVKAAEQAAAEYAGRRPFLSPPDVCFQQVRSPDVRPESALAGFAYTGTPEGPGSANADDGIPVLVWWTGQQILLRCQASCFDAGYLDRFAGYLSTALAALVAGPDAPWLDADLLSAAERHHLLAERTGPARTLPSEPVHRLIARQAQERPAAIAAVYLAERWSYDQVNRAANRVAHALLAAGLDAEDVVAVGTERDPHWLCAILGVFKAGGCYLPVEPDYPAGRVAELISRANVKFALTGPAGLPGFGAQAGLWCKPVTDLLDGGYPDTDPAVDVAPGQLAYVYFTSGSTGAPKGAMCEHLGMLNHVTAKVDDFGLGPGDVVVQNARQSFDISLWQLIAPLAVGGTTLILPEDHSLDVPRLVDAILDAGATVLQVVPAFLDVLLRYLEQHPRGLGRLRLVCVTGEAISKPLVVRWFACCPRITLVNAFGATEASDDTTHEIMVAPPPGKLVPVGRPVGNVTVYVLGPGDRLAPLGTPGEIAYSGICVGRGYINDPERTAGAFDDDPFRPGHRLYRTGDFGRWLPSGSLEFHGRRDEQVKVQGVRIELGEIEARAVAHPRVLAASVLVVPLPDGAKRLAVCYTSDSGLDPADLREHLARSLPSGAMPGLIERLESLPLTANGKVDKRALIARLGDASVIAERVGGAVIKTPTQQRIATAWAEALHRPVTDIGSDDSFFDLGGSSLSALRVVAGLNGLIGLDDLLRNPVLGALAAVADGERGAPGGVLRLLAGPTTGDSGESVALVCVPYAAGTAFSFQALASALAARDAGMAVYAVQPPGHDLGRRDVPLAELDELAKLLADEIGSLSGPVALWGHCAGVPIALETARLIGESVTHLFAAARLAEPNGALARELASITAKTDSELGAELAAEGGLDGLDGLSEADLTFTGRVYRHDSRIANQYLIQAGNTWQHQRLSCPITVVAAADDPLTRGYRERFADWGAFGDSVALAELDDGGHYFARTRSDQVAGIILRALRPTS